LPIGCPANPGQKSQLSRSWQPVRITSLAKKYLKIGFGGVLSFLIDGGKDAADEFINNLKLISHLANVGDAKTTYYSPASTTHPANYRTKSRKQPALIPGLVRLSVGIENVTDIIDGSGQAFEKSPAPFRSRKNKLSKTSLEV
jgi:O-acetylhomoserine/O-acetylserine sulfhydrylase-like pyridoxal-dependent enzyme